MNKYLSGSLVKIFVTKLSKDIGNRGTGYGADASEKWMEDCVAISWQTRQAKVPVYGHASYYYDGIMKGNIQVAGQFAIALNEPDRLYDTLLVNKQNDNLATIKEADKTRNISPYHMIEFHDNRSIDHGGTFNIVVIYGSVPYDQLSNMNIDTTGSPALKGERIVDVHIEGVSNTIAQDDNALIKVYSFVGKKVELLDSSNSVAAYSNRLFDVFNERQYGWKVTFSTSDGMRQTFTFTERPTSETINVIGIQTAAEQGIDPSTMTVTIAPGNTATPDIETATRQITGNLASVRDGDRLTERATVTTTQFNVNPEQA